MRILCLDIENAPPGWWAFKARRQFLGAGQQREQGELLCFGAKWLGKPKFLFSSIHDPGYEGMIQEAWNLLDEADAVMHYYGRRHDIPMLNTEFLKSGLGPPSPYKQIDLYYEVRRIFHFDYSSLDYVAKQLGLSGKRSMGGIAALNACRDGDEQAWQKMKRYNKQDVLLLEELYGKLQPWIRSPSLGARHGADVCPKCGSMFLKPRGYSFTQTGQFQRYRCNDCGAWSRATTRLAGTQLVEAS